MSAKKIAMAAAGATAASTPQIEYVGGYTTTLAGGTDSVNVTLTSLTGGIASSPSAGDLVVVYFAVAGATTNANLAISGYTEITENTLAGTYDVDLLVAYKYLTAADSSFTITGGTGDANDSGAVAVQVFRNAWQITSAEANANTSGAIPNPPSRTPTVAGSWIVAGGGGSSNRANATYSSSDLTNFISIGSNSTYDATVGMGYKVWTSGTFDPAAFTFSQEDSTAYRSVAVSFILTPNTGVGQLLYEASGDFVVPAGVTSISVVCVGGGEGANVYYGGAGASLMYVNDISVTPLETLSVVVGAAGTGAASTTSAAGGNGGDSSLKRSSTTLCLAKGGGSSTTNVGTGGNGGSGGIGTTAQQTVGGVNRTFYSGGGGGGAGGYSGAGGNGGGSNPTAGSGGGGGGGGRSTSGVQGDGTDYYSYDGGSGGGVGLNGSGSNGAAGENSPSYGGNGTAGSGGIGLTYGGGGNGGHSRYIDGSGFSNQSGSPGGAGGVRIIWPGNVRQFPSTRTANE